MTASPEIQGLGFTHPPTQDDLPYDDGVPMESQRHNLQMTLLIHSLHPWLDQREDGYVGGNMFVYFSLEQVKNKDFRGPDFFAVLGVPKRERKSWVGWEEGKNPDVVIELLSESTIDVDKGIKKDIYATRLNVPEYFWYDPFNPSDKAGFYLQAGHYQPMQLDEQGRLLSRVLGLALVQWQGEYAGVETSWLRWAYPDGRLLLTYTELSQQQAIQAQEQAVQAEQRANQAQEQAVQAEQRANQAESQVIHIARNLINAGMSVEQVAQMTGLSLDQVTELCEGSL